MYHMSATTVNIIYDNFSEAHETMYIYTTPMPVTPWTIGRTSGIMPRMWPRGMDSGCACRAGCVGGYAAMCLRVTTMQTIGLIAYVGTIAHVAVTASSVDATAHTHH